MDLILAVPATATISSLSVFSAQLPGSLSTCFAFEGEVVERQLLLYVQQRVAVSDVHLVQQDHFEFLLFVACCLSLLPGHPPPPRQR